MDLAIWRSLKLGCPAAVWTAFRVSTRTFVDNGCPTPLILCMFSCEPLSFCCPSWIVPSALPQISDQLHPCSPAALKADRLWRSWVGNMLLVALALNFYSGSSGEERAMLQKWGRRIFIRNLVQEHGGRKWCNKDKVQYKTWTSVCVSECIFVADIKVL